MKKDTRANHPIKNIGEQTYKSHIPNKEKGNYKEKSNKGTKQTTPCLPTNLPNLKNMLYP